MLTCCSGKNPYTRSALPAAGSGRTSSWKYLKLLSESTVSQSRAQGICSTGLRGTRLLSFLSDLSNRAFTPSAWRLIHSLNMFTVRKLFVIRNILLLITQWHTCPSSLYFPVFSLVAWNIFTYSALLLGEIMIPLNIICFAAYSKNRSLTLESPLADAEL